MTVPVWMLLGFATWTMLLLLFTVGVYRWGRIFTGRVAIRNFPAFFVQFACFMWLAGIIGVTHA